jgi:hypothetical protein
VVRLQGIGVGGSGAIRQVAIETVLGEGGILLRIRQVAAEQGMRLPITAGTSGSPGGDQLHPNEAGHQRMAGIWSAAILAA